MPEVKCFSEEVLEVGAPGLTQAGVQRGHAVYRPDGLPDTAGHQTLLDHSTAGKQHLTHYCFCQGDCFLKVIVNSACLTALSLLGFRKK